VRPDPLPKADFLKLYAVCGDVLHRGSMRRFLSGSPEFKKHATKETILDWLGKIHRFLDIHIILLANGGGKHSIFCSMSGGQDGHVAVHPIFAK
jgi:hypothetical protein